MPPLERWVLHRLTELDRAMRQATEDFDYHAAFAALHAFCAVDLSAFYFDIRKDALYCDRADDPVRQAARTVLDQLFRCLTLWLAPVLCFTAEEAWLTRYRAEVGEPGPEVSVHLQQFPELPAAWHDSETAARWEIVRDIRAGGDGSHRTPTRSQDDRLEPAGIRDRLRRTDPPGCA